MDIATREERPGTLVLPAPPSLGTRLKVWYRRKKLDLFATCTTPKIGVMYTSQRFAMMVGIEPLKAEFCETCGRERPHTFWPGGRHFCLICVHRHKTVDFRICGVCGPGFFAIQPGGDFGCYTCWLAGARRHLDRIRNLEVVPIKKPLLRPLRVIADFSR